MWHRRSLIEAMLDGEQSAGAQAASGVGGDGADGVQAVAAGGERRTWLEAQIAPVEMRDPVRRHRAGC
jgi:hypothetical protein